MSKRRNSSRFPQRVEFDDRTIMLGIPNRHWPENPPVAFKVERNKINDLLKKPSYANPAIPDDYHLIGLQVEFRKNMDDVDGAYMPLAQLQFTQIYFKESPTSGESYFWRYSDLLGNKLDLDETMAIETDLQSTEPSYELDSYAATVQLPLGGPVNNNNFIQQRLDFYSPIGYVYFPIGQLKFLTRFYHNLIFSGIQIKLGKRLSDTNQNLPFRDAYFSLKIEGADRRRYDIYNDDQHQRTFGSDSNSEIAEGSDILFGHPCPPFWETFINVMGPIIGGSSNSDGLLDDMQEIWEAWKVVITTTWPPAQDQL